jgi:hypothetical protein
MIIINGIKYPVKTGYGTIYLFCVKKKIEFGDFIDRVSAYNFDKITNEFIDDMAEFVLCCIERCGNNDLPSKYDVLDWMLENHYEEVFSLFNESLGLRAGVKKENTKKKKILR